MNQTGHWVARLRNRFSSCYQPSYKGYYLVLKFNSSFTPWKVTESQLGKDQFFPTRSFSGASCTVKLWGDVSFHPPYFCCWFTVFVARCEPSEWTEFFSLQNPPVSVRVGCRDSQVRWYHFFTNTYIGVFIVSTPTSKWNHLFILGFAFKHAMKMSKTLHSAVVCHGS